MPLHLLFPLFSSVMFVLAMMFAKQAIDRGVRPWTATFLSNFWLASFWVIVAIVRWEIVPIQAWGHAAIIAVLFVLGQLFTYLAFQYGDVSVATPVFGVKVLMVAGLVAFATGTPVASIIWIAGAMAFAGIVLIQWSGGKQKPQPAEDEPHDPPADGSDHAPTEHPLRRQLVTILLALTAAFCLSLFDVTLQTWAKSWDSYAFLPVMFGMAGILSVGFLVRADGPKRVHKLGATRWLLTGTVMVMLQALSLTYALAEFGDAPRINIVYALRGLWGVVLAWAFAKKLGTSEADHPKSVMIRRLIGACLLVAAVLFAMTA